MVRRLLIALLSLGALLAIGWQFADAQEEEEVERSRFVQFVERQISTPDRQIRLGRIEGALSSDVRISSITISDREGVWLRIEGAHLIWSRLALLRGQLDIDLLEAERIEISRPPNAPEEETPPEAQIEIPELPVGVDIDQLNVPRIDIAEGVIGPAVALSAEGELHLNDGSLQSNLQIERLDRPGSLVLEAAFSNETRVLDLTFRLSEPEDGVVANALNIPGRPPVTFAIEGSGPLDEFAADISLAADGEQLVSGTATISQAGDGLRFVADVDGNLQPLVPPLYQDLVQGGSRLVIDATRSDDGAVSISRAEITSGVASLTASAQIAPDGFPTALDLDVSLGSEGGDPVALPGGGGAATVQSGTINVTLGGQVDNTWVATFDLQDLKTPLVSAERARIMGSGLAANMADPENRRITFEVTGSAEGLSSDNPDVAEALGDQISLQARGDWSSGSPVDVQVARVENPNALTSFEGQIEAEKGLDGAYTLRAQDLSLFSGLVGQPLDGSVDVSATGTIGLGGDDINLQVQGQAQDLALGIPALDGLFEGETTLSGGIGRSRTGFRFDELTVENPQLTARVHGGYGEEDVNLTARAELADISALSDRASGAATIEAALTGTAARPDLEATISSDRLTLTGRPLTGLRAQFEGQLVEGTRPNGEVSIIGNLDGVPLDASAEIASLEDGTRVLSDLSAQAGRNTASGNLTLRSDGFYEGDISLDAPDVAAIAPLFLADASGAVAADIALSIENGGQSADVEASATDFRFNTIEVGSAAVDLAGENLLSAPILSGSASASAVRVGDFVLDEVELTAERSGDTTTFEVAADLAAGTLTATGTIEPVETGFDLTLQTLGLTHQGIEAELASPAEIGIRDGEISIESADLRIGSGGITISGTVGDELDLSATVDQLPLELGNAFMPDLELEGTVSGRLEATGTTTEPVADFQLTGRGIGAAPLRQAGVSGLEIETAGQYRDGTVELTLDTDIGGGTVNVSGSVGEALDVEVEIDGLPLSLANAFLPDLGLGGTVSGTAQATGSLEDPSGTFDVEVEGLTAEVLRQAGVGPLAATAEGSVAGRTVTLESASISGSGISVTASGTVPLEGSGLDVRIESQGFPLAAANAFLPDLGLGGTLTGTAQATGSLQDPRGTFDVRVEGLTADVLRQAGVGPLAATAEGSISGRTITLRSGAIRGDGISATASGTVPLEGSGLNVRVELQGLPLAAANAFAPGLGLQGTLTGTATATGSISNPQAVFDVSGQGVSAAPLREAGLSPLSVSAEGRFQNQTVRLTRASVEGGGLSLMASGTVPLSGSGLDVAVDGSIPLSLSDRFLAGRGARLSGAIDLDARVTGSISNPQFSGSLAADGVTFADPESGLRLSNIRLRATLSGEQLVIQELSAALGDGSVSVSGTIGISPAGNFPADLRIALRQARYEDPQLIAATLSGDLTLTGPLLGQPLLSGSVFVDRAEITVPERFGGGAVLIDVRHVNAPADVLATLAKAGLLGEDQERVGSEPSGIRLDLRIDAPNQIFVRGRGLDAELGGSLRLTGPISNLSPVGAFEMIRGRIDILGQRITFDRGEVTLFGDLDPYLDFQATTTNGGVAVTVNVVGRASDPEITFSSNPDLPQDEILAQLLFGRSLDDLSPFQIAQLASAAAQLAGGGPSILDQLRVATGLDNLDVVTTEGGGTALQAGRYIDENIYLGLTAGEQTGVSINLDVTENLKLRAEAGTHDSSIGIFYEREY